MTQTQAMSSEGQGNPVARFIAFLYGVAVHFTFFGTIPYSVDFTIDLPVPKTINGAAASTTAEALGNR